MRIMSKVELLNLLEWASEGGVPKGPLPIDPPVDNPLRYGRSDPTYGPPQYGPPHRTMEETHFYYVGMGELNQLRTLVYHLEGTAAVPDAEIVSWIADARKKGAEALSRRFADVKWHNPGFLVFFIDLPGWNFLEKTNAGGAQNRALYFAEVMDSNNKPVSRPNHSFYNAHTLVLQDPAESYALLVVENHHLKAPGPDTVKYQPRKIGDEDDDYKYDIFLTLAIEHGTADDVFPIVLDPGGKNVGPP